MKLTFLPKVLRSLKVLLLFRGKNDKVGMDDIREDYAILDNIEKAKRGRKFENEIDNLLKFLKNKGVVDHYVRQPIYEQCFRPDFEVHIGDTIIVIDVTTTVRTDREKGKLWDAYWAKQTLKRKYPGKVIEAITVVQKTTGREWGNYVRAKAYIEKCSKPYDAVDYIMTLEEFIRHIYKLKGLEPPI